MNLTFEKINKNLLLVAIAALFFRVGSFSNFFFPKPFEAIFSLVCILSFIYVIRERKLKEFFASVPLSIWTGIVSLVGAVIIGWNIAVFHNHIPSTQNMILELGTLLIGLILLVLVSFYSKNDTSFAKKCLYAVLVPIVYVFFVAFPHLATSLNLTNDIAFIGFTSNVSILSKMLVVPVIFFSVYSFFENKNIYKKISFMAISAGSLSIIFWTAERGALLSVAFTMIVVWLAFSLNKFTWKKMLFTGFLTAIIIIAGFIAAPHNGKKVIVDRILNLESNQYGYEDIKDQSLLEIAKKSLVEKKNSKTSTVDESKKYSSEPRIDVWVYYIKEFIGKPFGVGPNTHIEARVEYYRGVFINPGPHNTYIQVWLWGGIIALGGFLLMIFAGIKNLIEKLRYNFDAITVVLLGSLIALSVALIFNDALSFYYFWIILALSLKK